MTSETRTQIFLGGTVRIDESTTAEALAVSGGRVEYFGPAAEALERFPGADHIDVTGLVVAPGLIDSHPHALHFALFAAPLVDITAAESWSDITAAIGQRAAQTSAGEWIMTTPVGEEHFFVRRSWRDLQEGCLPDAAALDAVTTDHPVMIQGWAPNSPNVVAFNSTALAVLGVDSSTPDGDGGVFVEKDDAGRPTGRLTGSVNNYYNHNQNEFWAGAWAKIPYIQPQLIPTCVGLAFAKQNARGVTTIYEGHAMEPEHVGGYIALNQAGILTVRVLAATEVLGAAMSSGLDVPDENRLDAHLAAAKLLEGDHGEFLKVRGITLTPTGPADNGHLVMREKYLGPTGEQTGGRWFIPPALLATALRRAAEGGTRVNLCGGGLGEHDVVIAELDKLRAEGLLKGDEEWIFQHAMFLAPEHAASYAKHGVRITTSIGYTHGGGDMIRERIGEHVLCDLNPFRRTIDAGVLVAGSTDWGPTNPFECMALSVTHEIGKGATRNDGAAQRIEREEAYAMWGRRASEVLGWEGVGDLHVGSHADIAVLDRDPVTCPLADLPQMRVQATLLGGYVVHGTLAGVQQ